MQVTRGGQPGRAGQCEAFRGVDVIADPDADPGQVRVLGDQLLTVVAAVIDHHQIAVAAVPAGLDHGAAIRRDHRRATGGVHVHAVVHAPVVQDRMESLAVAAGDGTRNGSHEVAAVGLDRLSRRRRSAGVIEVARVAVGGAGRHLLRLRDEGRRGDRHRCDAGNARLRLRSRHRGRRGGEHRGQHHGDADGETVQHPGTRRHARRTKGPLGRCMPHCGRSRGTARRRLLPLCLIWRRGHPPPSSQPTSEH